jgi:hypothetical protein
MSKAKNRDRAKPKSALNLAEHRAGVAPGSTLTASGEHEQLQLQGEPSNLAARPVARKKEKRLGHN